MKNSRHSGDHICAGIAYPTLWIKLWSLSLIPDHLLVGTVVMANSLERHGQVLKELAFLALLGLRFVSEREQDPASVPDAIALWLLYI